MQTKYVNGSNQDFITLCQELDNYLNIMAGGEENRARYLEHNKLEEATEAIILYEGEEPIGCGSYKHLEEEIAELKRIYIKKEFRGKGISKILIKLLEERISEQGYQKIVLETATVLREAMSLYENIGYETIPNYGPYKCMKESICMGKNLPTK